MDYYQGVVNEYLRANRATFINTEFCIQLAEGNPDLAKGSHWYCDAVALSFVEKTIYLCEVSFAAKAPTLRKRLLAWSKHWDEVQAAVKRDGYLSGPVDGWAVKPWLFMPENGVEEFERWWKSSHLSFTPKVTSLEETQPWRYRSWDRKVDMLAEPVHIL